MNVPASRRGGDGIVVEPTRSNPLEVAAPARHPLLGYQRIPGVLIVVIACINSSFKAMLPVQYQ